MAVLALAAAVFLPAPDARATTAADVCGATENPCQLRSELTVTPGSTLDFGTRAFEIKAPNGRLQVGAGDTLSITAGSMTVESGTGGRLRGDGGCIINVALTGAFAVTRVTGGLPIGIDISSNTDQPCELYVVAGGDVTIGAEVQARGSLNSGGGSLAFTSGGRLTIAERILVLGPIAAGSAEFDAQGAIEVTDAGAIDASDAFAIGSIVLDAGADLTVRGKLDVNGNGARPEFGCDGGFIILGARGNITIDAPISGTGASLPDIGCIGGSLEMSAGGSIFVNAQLDFSGGPNGVGGILEPIEAGVDFVQTAPILVRGTGGIGVGGDVEINAARRLHVGDLLDVSGGDSVEPDGFVMGGGGNLVLRGRERVEIAGEVDADGADFGSLLFTTAAEGAQSIPGLVDVTGEVHAVSSALEDLSADIRFEACEINVAAGASVTKSGPASRNLLRASADMTIGGALEAGAGTNELQHRDPSRPPLILPGAFLSPPPLVTATPDEPLPPCACTLDPGVPGAFCNDGNPCTQEVCDDALGCTSVPLSGEGVAGCDDGTVCNGREACAAQTCLAGTPPVADDGDPCTQDGPCDPVAGYAHTVKTGLGAAACRMDRIELVLATAEVPGDLSAKALKKIRALARSIRSLVGRADFAGARRRAKLLRAARRKVRSLDHAIASPKSQLTAELAQLLKLATSEARAELGI